MAKLKVTAFKKSGKYYTEETYDLENFPSVWNQPKESTLEQLHDLQMKECNRIWGEIKRGNMRCYCPVTNWNNFFFAFDGIFENSENGFLTYLLDRTGEK